MNKYEVVWKELRYVKCVAEVEATTKKEAIELAQDYEVDVDEIPGDTYEMFDARASLIED